MPSVYMEMVLGCVASHSCEKLSVSASCIALFYSLLLSPTQSMESLILSAIVISLTATAKTFGCRMLPGATESPTRVSAS